MPDRITANLPAIDMAATEAFYGKLGFATRYRSQSWMILAKGPLELEFFHAPDLDPKTSWHSACIRVDNLDALHRGFGGALLPADNRSIPRMSGIERLPAPDLSRIFFLVDLNGSLLRCLENGAA